jgi:hypothetical protein
MMTAKRFLPTASLVAFFLVAACGPDADPPDAPAEEAPAAEAATAMQAAPACFLQGATLQEAAERASPLDSAMVTLGGAEAKVCYGAPSVNERVIMGELVPFDQPWRTGANEATVLHLPFPAQVAGVSVEPGSYSLYTVPTTGDWQVVVNANAQRWGIPINDDVRAADLGTGTVTPEAIDAPVERMTFEFDRISDTEAHLVMEWETTRLRIPVVRTGG